jgi:hypothetical protein
MMNVEDRLAPFGVAVGVVLVVGSLGTLLGAPWSSGGVAVTALQLVGVVLGAGIGAGLAWLSYGSGSGAS